MIPASLISSNCTAAFGGYGANHPYRPQRKQKMNKSSQPAFEQYKADVNIKNSEATESYKPLEVHSLEQVMNNHYPEQEYVVDGIVPEASITILSGASRSYKTYTLLHMATSIASGKMLFGKFATQQAGVLIIDEENGERLLQKRLFQLGSSMELPVHFLSYSGFITTDKYISEVLKVCLEKGIKLIIIDSLIRVHSGDENSAKDMSKVFKQLRQFTEKGVAVLVTQHNRKQGAFGGSSGDEMRGSSDIMAAVDSHVGVVRKNKWYLTFTQTKQRYDEELDPFEVKANVTPTTFDFEYLGQIKGSEDTAEVVKSTIEQLLSDNKQLNQKDLLTQLNSSGVAINEHKLRELLRRWVSEGSLPQPYAGDGNTKLYHLEVEDA